MSTVEEYLKQLNKQTAANTEKKVEAVNNAAATSSQIIKDNYDLQIKQNDQIYENALDENAIQRRINEHMILRDLTNTGDTNSGLSRTQMTAVQLSHANNQAKIKRQQQAAYEGFLTAMNSELSKIETDRATQEASIRTADYDANYNKAVSMYNAEQQAISDSIAAAQKQQQDDYDKVMAALGNKNYSDEFKQQYINNFKNKYGYTGAQVQQMFGSPGTKYTYSDDELGNGATATWDEDVLLGELKRYHQQNENKDSLYSRVNTLKNRYGWSWDTAYAFIDEILQKTEQTRSFWKNPHIDNVDYTNVDTTDETITDFGGNVWTYDEFRKASKIVLAKEKAAKVKAKADGTDWDKLTTTERQSLIDKITEKEYNKYFDDSDVEKQSEIQLNRVINSLN